MQTMSGSNDGCSAPVARKRLRLPARLMIAGALALSASITARPALACGGFFCSAISPVNQAAERIVFAKNSDATVTAVIEIQYQGPSTDFSWLLPISTVPKGDQIAVASNVAFQRLQQATNPQYNLTIRVEGTCDEDPNTSKGLRFGSATSAPMGSEDAGAGHGVTVEASGVVGSFEWTVISLDKSLTNPADVAVTWLGKNGYDVPQGAPGLLGPYLQDGLYLLALRLKKGADSGSIRPIVLTYDADKPMIPIKLTSVAANDDMGVLTWLLGEAQAVPVNYYALELNEARINWFNASTNYNQVVTDAANSAGGQGFVTEMAGPTTVLQNQIWTTFDEQAWQRVQLASTDQRQAYQNAAGYFSSLDGFSDVVRDHVTFATGVTPAQIKQCPGCYLPSAVDTGFVTALEANVIEPMRLVQKLFDAHPQMTRLYTTMSAAEMTVDPLFSFNPDLTPLSNIHTAERVIECGPGYYQSDAPWRIELPHGGVVRGGPTQVGTWPGAFDAQPPNRRIMRQAESGEGKVLEDNTPKIKAAVDDYSATVHTPMHSSSSGCSMSGQRGSAGAWWALLGASLLLRRRRR
jgi:MYXO-CTERM domain-containing protein